MDHLTISLQWDARVHQWRASCASYPSLAARAPTPSRARRGLLRKLKAAVGPCSGAHVSEAFLLPDECQAKHEQWRTDRAAAAAFQASAADVERDLIVSLRNLRLSIAQIARTLELTSQHVDAVLQQTAMRACFAPAEDGRAHADTRIASAAVQAGQPASRRKPEPTGRTAVLSGD